jgi:hypothetical protein
MSAFQDALVRFRLECKWMAFIDDDEFLVPRGQFRELTPLLKKYAASSNLFIRHARFGSSGHLTPPKGLLFDEFLWRQDPKFEEKHEFQVFGKSIVQPKLQDSPWDPHVFIPKVVYAEAPVRDGKIYPMAMKKTKFIPRSECEVFHYSMKSLAEFEEKKKKGGGVSSSYKNLKRAAYDWHDIQDSFARDQYSAALNKRLKKKCLA